MLYEIGFWGGPKDGLIEYYPNIPNKEIYFPEQNDVSFINQEEITTKANLKYSVYVLKKNTKRKFTYVYDGVKSI